MCFRCWRTRNSCSSKYSRTMVSLTADILGEWSSGVMEYGSDDPAGSRWAIRFARAQNLLKQLRGHLVAELDFSNFSRQNEFDLPVPHLLVELHGRQELVALSAIEPDTHRQHGALEKQGDTLSIFLSQAHDLR